MLSQNIQAPAHGGSLDEAHDMLQILHEQVTSPLKKGTFCPIAPWLQHPQAEQRGSKLAPQAGADAAHSARVNLGCCSSAFLGD